MSPAKKYLLVCLLILPFLMAGCSWLPDPYPEERKSNVKKTAELLRQAGDNAMFAYEDELARGLYDQALEMNPDLNEDPAFTGRRWLAHEEFLKALEAFKKAAGSDESEAKDAVPRFLQLRALRGAGLLDQADVLLAEFKSENPAMPQAYMERAFLYWERGRLDRASDSFWQVSQISPEFARAYFYLGRTYLERHDYTKAEHALKAALQYNKEMSDAYMALGDLAYARKLKDKALLNYREFMNRSLDPEAKIRVGERIRMLEALPDN
jgi:tetratricopeptide (TPR) repeat protein